MKISANIPNQLHFQIALNQKVDEMIFHQNDLTKNGGIQSFEELNEMLLLAYSNGIKTSIEWDLLMKDEALEKSIECLSKLNFKHISAFRVQDLGAFEYLLGHPLKPTIYLNTKHGFHNQDSFKLMLENCEGSVKRFILSSELPAPVISEYASNLNCELEIQLISPILLFYGPRKLLSPHFKRKEGENLKALATSLETAHKNFGVIESSHGTLMYHPKDFFILDRWEEISEMNVKWGRIDLSHLEEEKDVLEEIYRLSIKIAKSGDKEALLKLEKIYPRNRMRGYFHNNKTDILFPKLKNHRLQKRSGEYLGEILDVLKGKSLALSIRSNKMKLSLNDKIRIVSPDGKEKVTTVNWIKDLKGEEIIESVSSGQLVLIPAVGGVCVKASVYLTH